MAKQELIQIMPKHGSHLWHVWMNKRNEGRAGSDDWEHSTYEFKNLIDWLQYGHERIASAFEDRLPKTHRQCSLSEAEAVPQNVLKCCLGEDVTTCQILASLRKTIGEYREQPFYRDFSDADLYRLMSFTCGWHIFTTAVGVPKKHQFHCDTSEGYMLDVTDRMFWDRVYSSMSMG